jgi:hypothetical protein
MSDRGDVDSGGDHQHEGEELDDGKGRGGGRGEYRRFRPRYVRRGGSRNYNKPEGEDGEQHLEEHQARVRIVLMTCHIFMNFCLFDIDRGKESYCIGIPLLREALLQNKLD